MEKGVKERSKEVTPASETNGTSAPATSIPLHSFTAVTGHWRARLGKRTLELGLVSIMYHGTNLSVFFYHLFVSPRRWTCDSDKWTCLRCTYITLNHNNKCGILTWPLTWCPCTRKAAKLYLLIGPLLAWLCAALRPHPALQPMSPLPCREENENVQYKNEMNMTRKINECFGGNWTSNLVRI